MDIPSDGDGIDRKGVGGRPKEVPKYGKDGSARGRDPLGAHDKRKAFAANKKYGVALAHYDSLKKQMGKDVNTTDKQILDTVTEFYLLTNSQLIYSPSIPESGFSKVAAKFKNIKVVT